MRKYALVALLFLAACSMHQAPASQKFEFSADLPKGIPVPDKTWRVEAAGPVALLIPDTALSVARGMVPAQWMVREKLCPDTHTPCRFQLSYRSWFKENGDDIEQIAQFIVQSNGEGGPVRECLIYAKLSDPNDAFYVRQGSEWKLRTDSVDETLDGRMLIGIVSMLNTAYQKQGPSAVPPQDRQKQSVRNDPA